MASNTLYDIARNMWANGQLNWEGQTFHCCLLSGDYVFSASHTNLSDVPPNTRDYGLSGSGGILLTDKTVDTNGALRATQVRFVTVDELAPQVTAVLIYQLVDGGDDSLNIPVYYASSATGLPIAPNGGDIIVTWSTGTNGILRL